MTAKPLGLPVGAHVRSIAINWGEGWIISVQRSRGLKPYTVRRADGVIGYFHADQLEEISG